jgi:outer membrane protein insertion porin family
VAEYNTYSTGVGMRFGIPVTEYDTVQAGITAERTKLAIDLLTAPPRYVEYINLFGETSDTLRLNTAFARDTRDSLTWPTRGWLNEIGIEIGIPPGDLTYYRLNYQSQLFYTLERLPWLTFMANAEFGYADGYQNKPLPFFKNFYAGGVGSVRTFETASLGPKDLNGDVLGGNRRFIANFEALFPMPGYKEKNVRLALFADVGNVWGAEEKVSASMLRWSAGLAVSWDSPMGPLRFSFGVPLKELPGDRIERFQFQLGKVF